MDPATVRVGGAAVLYLPAGDTRAQCPPAPVPGAAIALQACRRFQASREAGAQPLYTVIWPYYMFRHDLSLQCHGSMC